MVIIILNVLSGGGYFCVVFRKDCSQLRIRWTAREQDETTVGYEKKSRYIVRGRGWVRGGCVGFLFLFAMVYTYLIHGTLVYMKQTSREHQTNGAQHLYLPEPVCCLRRTHFPCSCPATVVDGILSSGNVLFRASQGGMFAATSTSDRQHTREKRR